MALPQDMFDEVFTRSGTGLTPTKTILAAKTGYRPFLLALTLSVTSTVEIGGRVVYSGPTASDSPSMLFVGNSGEAITLASGTSVDVVCTCGYLRTGLGEGLSALIT